MVGAFLSGRYEILQEIGRGGMGVVYAAHDTVLQRKVAIKVISPGRVSEEQIERFQREARVIAAMDHPSIVGIHDIGHHAEITFLIMPYVPGTNLRAYISDGSLRIVDMLEIAIQVADALDYSHQSGVIHRDIKPENILLTKNDFGEFRARITDFGLARVVADNRLTQSGALVGTVCYLSPEQVYQTDMDGRSDIYSLATVLYECICGAPPFTGDFQEVIYRIVHEMPLSPAQKGFQIDKELQNILMEALQKDPQKRPPRAKILAQALTGYKASLQLTGRADTVIATPELIHFVPPDRPLLVGRDKELTEMQHRLNSAMSGECQFVIIGGEEGVGKSRLMQELEMLARARKVQVLHGRFVGEEQGFRYQGFCEAIQEFFRSRAITTSSPSIDFSDLAPDLRTFFPVLGEIGGIRGGSSADAPSPRGGSNDPLAVYDLLARTIIRIGGGKPLLLLFEELHSAGASADALQYIVRRMGPTPTLILASYRTSETDKRHPLIGMIGGFEGDRRFAHLLLQSFDPEQQRKYVEALLDSDRIDQQLLRRITEITEGNPFFMKELIHSLLDVGAVIQDDSGRWVISTDISGPFLPVTIQQAVEKRLRELPPQLHELLLTASILGKNFSFRDLQILSPGIENLEELIEQLLHKGFLEEERFSRGDQLAFSSGVLREVLYSSLSRSRRKALHRNYAEVLENRNSGNLQRVYPQLVHHFLQADIPSKIILYGMKLAQKSLEAFSIDEAIRAGKTVLDYLEEETGLDGSVGADVKMILAEAYRLKSTFDAALKEVKDAIQILEKDGPSEQLLNAIIKAAETAWSARKIDEALHWIETGLSIARDQKRKPALIKLLSLAATVCNLRGDYSSAQSHLEEMERIRSFTEVEESKQAGGALTVAIPYSVHPLHPVELKLDEEAEILANVFEQLNKMDSEGNVIPWLCEKWENTDEKTFTLIIRKNIRFHDGTPLTAEEVRSSLQRAISLAPYNMPPAFSAIRGVSEFLDKRTNEISGILAPAPEILEIHLNEVLPIYPALLTELRTAIVREEMQNGKCWRFGTGPFQIDSYEGTSLVLKRNENYWKGNPPLLDTLQFSGSLSAAEIGAGFRRGIFDLVRDLMPEDLEEFLRQRPLRATLADATKKNVYFILFNIYSPVMRDLQVRRALCGVIRKQDLVRRTIGRFAQPAEGLFPPGILGHDPEARSYPLNHQEACGLLKAADSLPLRLRASVHPILQDRYSSVTNALFSAWHEIGVEVSIETPTMESFLRSLRENESIDVMIGRWIAEYDDPDSFTYSLFHTKAGDRSSFVGSAELDRWIEEARAESRVGVRGRLYRRIEAYLLDTFVFFPLFHELDFRLASPRIKDLALKSIAPYVNYSEITVTEAPAAGARPGGTLEVPIAGVVNSLDPSLVSTAVESQVTPAIFETLFRQSEGTIVPWLIEKFQILDGGSKFWFRLHPMLRFHDGRRLTARDVRYTLERLLSNHDSDSRHFFLPIRGALAILNGERADLEGLRILSATDFIIELEERISFFPALMAYYSAAIVPEGTEEFRASWKDGCVGTGPYRVVRFQPGVKLELEANPYYWNLGFPRNDKLTFVFGLSPAEISKQFESGKFSVAWDLAPSDVDRLLSDPQYASHYKEIPRLCTYFAVFNTDHGPLANEEIRRQLLSSVDVEKLIRKNLGRLAIPAYGLIPPGLIGYQPKHERPPSPARDRKMQKDLELTCVLNPVYSGPYASVARDLFAILRENGFIVRVVNQKRHDYPEFHGLLDAAKADFALARWVGDYPDSDTFGGILYSKQKIAGKFCGSPELDRLITAGRVEPDASIRNNIYAEVEQILEQQARILPLFHEQVFCFAAPNIEGFDLNFFSPIVPYEKLSLRK